MNFGVHNVCGLIQFGRAFVGFVDQNFGHSLDGDAKGNHGVIGCTGCIVGGAVIATVCTAVGWA